MVERLCFSGLIAPDQNNNRRRGTLVGINFGVPLGRVHLFPELVV